MPNESAAESAKLQAFDLYNLREHFGKALNAIEFPSYLTGYDIRFLIKAILQFLLNLESQLEQIPVTEDTYLQFQKIFLLGWDDTYHHINNLTFETKLQTQLIFQSGDRKGIINLDPFMKFLINLSEKKQAVAEQWGLSRYVEKSITEIIALPVKTVNADSYEVTQDFIVFKQLEEFILLFTERFYSELRRKDKNIKNSSYCAVLVLLLLLEGKLKNKLITKEICTKLIRKYNSQKPPKYNFLLVLSDAKLITIVNETLVLTEEFFNNIQKGEAEVALKFTANEKLINLAVPIAKLINATSELKGLALGIGLHEYVSLPDNTKQYAPIYPATNFSKASEKAEKPISSTRRMNISNLLSDESESAELERPTSSISQWNIDAQDSIDIQEETVGSVPASNSLNYSISHLIDDNFKPLNESGSQTNPISLSDVEESESTDQWNAGVQDSMNVQEETVAPTPASNVLNFSVEQIIAPTVVEPISFSLFSPVEQSTTDTQVNTTTANLEQDLNQQFIGAEFISDNQTASDNENEFEWVKVPELFESTEILDSGSATAPLGQTRRSSRKEPEHRPSTRTEKNLEVFTLKKNLEKFKKKFGNDKSENSESEIKPKIPLAVQDMVLIVLLFIEGYIRERKVSTKMCNVLLSKKGIASQKLRKLINQKILSELDGNSQHKLLNSTFLNSLKQGDAEISILVKGNAIEIDLKPLIIKLLSLDDELKKLAKKMGLNLYVISDEPLNFNGITLNDGEMLLNNIFAEDFERITEGADFLDSLQKFCETSQGESLLGIFNDPGEQTTDNLGKRNIEDVFEELDHLRKENDRLKRQRKEETPAPELQKESETQGNISNFLTNMNSTLGSISTPSQSIEPELSETELNKIIQSLLLP